MRRTIQLIFVTVILISIYLSFDSYLEKQWEALTASLSLIIAIISAWIAYEAFYKQNESEKPQLILSLDMKSRFGIIQLAIENFGNRPAYNIQLHWKSPILRANGDLVTFTRKDQPIPVLNKAERLSVLVDGTTIFYDKYKSTNLDYQGTISHTPSIKSKKRYLTPFYLSLESYKMTLALDNEQLNAYHELAKVPKSLSKIEGEIKLLRETLGRDS